MARVLFVEMRCNMSTAVDGNSPASSFTASLKITMPLRLLPTSSCRSMEIRSRTRITCRSCCTRYRNTA